jgi:dihydrofolate reductase
MNEFYMIVAHDHERGIGVSNDLPWKLKGDMKFFKRTTLGNELFDKTNSIIMGRNTWESIPDNFKPLKGRHNIVVSTKSKKELGLPEDVYLANSIESALFISKELCSDETYIIGGASIYRQCISMNECNGIFVTEVSNNTVKCDTFFPEYTDIYSADTEIEKGHEGDLSYSIKYYRKK